MTAQPGRARFSETQWYFAGQSAWFAGAGLQGVLFAWLVTVVLDQDARWIGILQMMSMLPMPFLVLFGGAAADARDLRTHLVEMQALILLPLGVLGAALAFGFFDYTVLTACAFAMGVCTALVMPARDAALNGIARNARGDLMRLITAATGIQFGGQIVGLALGGIADATGALPLVGATAVLFAFAAFAASRIAPQPPQRARQRQTLKTIATDIREGIAAALADRNIRAVITLLFGTGILFMGVFMVVLPVMIRDVYAGGSFELALANICFMAGVTISTFTLMRLPAIARPGATILMTMIVSWLAMVAIHFAPPVPLFYAVLVLWGCAGGVSMSMSRSIVQENAPDDQVARVISVYQLALMGGSPIGAFAIGFVIAEVGVSNAVLVPVAGVALLWLVARFATPLWQVRRPEKRTEPDPAAVLAAAGARETPPQEYVRSSHQGKKDGMPSDT